MLRAGVATAVDGLGVAHARGGVQLSARGKSSMTRCHCLYETRSVVRLRTTCADGRRMSTP
jgi:hypothetical protein